MPMPTGGAWPPPHIAPAYLAYRDWDAWYTGDADLLARTYQGRSATGAGLPPSQRPRPGQYSGGVVGAVFRWLWGAPSPTTSRDPRLHVPLPADLAATAAGLLLSEAPALVADDTATQTRLEELEAGGLISTLRHAAEAASALGDVYLCPVVDQDVSPDRAITSVVHADGAVPVLRWGHLVEVTFWSELSRDGGVVVRLLEHHDVVAGAGRITYAVHAGNDTELGRAIGYADHPASAYLLGYKLDAEGSQATGLDRLDVVRIPNAGPQRRWRKVAGLKYLGRSDFDGNEAVFDRIDAVWTSWMQDIYLGRGRVHVPAYMLENLGPGQGAGWDADRAVYSALNAMPSQTSGDKLTMTQFEIRHVEHKATVDALTEVAMRHAGLSSQTLGEEGDVAMTATEAQSRERMSFVTRGDRIASWQPGIADYIELHMRVEHLNNMSTVEPVRPAVEFADSVTESPETTARTIQMLRAAEVISIETGVRMAHKDWDKIQVAAEVARIKADMGSPVEDPGTFTGDLSGAPLPEPPEQPPAEA